MVGGGQRMTIGWCASSLYKGSIIHEHLHTLGFWHEQSRPDRDNSVRIEFDNIQAGRAQNFYKQIDSRTLGVPYDFESLMHYPKGAFAKSYGLQTIVTLPNGENDDDIGQRNAFTTSDLEGLQLLYQCVSGSRTRSQMNDNPCTKDCKCAKNKLGCRVNGVDIDSVCMGNLGCVNDICVNNASPTSPRPNSNPTPMPNSKPPTPISHIYFENKQHTGKCMDLAGSDTNNGNDVVLLSCNGGSNQKWRMDENGYIRSAIDDNKCIETRSRNVASGADIQIWDCVPNYSLQQWIHVFDDNTIRPKLATTQCIDVENVDEFSLQLWICNGVPDKVWIAKPTTTPTMTPTMTNSPTITKPTTTKPPTRPSPRPTPLPSSCDLLTDSKQCRNTNCCRWNRKNKTCKNAPCGNGCKDNVIKVSCLRDSQACCVWKRNEDRCTTKRRCGNCVFRTTGRYCNNDGCCQWSDSIKKCSNKNVCTNGRRVALE